MIPVLVPAYNESANLQRLLPRLKADRGFEVTVVASGCTDDTVAVAKANHVSVIVQDRREGKTSAINAYLRAYPATYGDILIMESADTLPAPFCFDHLLAPLRDPKVGMVGAHPIPSNTALPTRILWGAHHEIAKQRPKCGELVAFRRVFDQMPSTSVDEAMIERLIVNRGYRLVYAPEAIVYNHGPETFADLLKQRRRIAKGHRALKAAGYPVSTDSLIACTLAVYRAMPKTPAGVHAVMQLVAAELAARLQRHEKEETIWTQIASSKAVR